MTNISANRLSRRRFLQVTTALCAQTVAAPAFIGTARAATETLASAPSGFRRLFPDLPLARHDVEDLTRLATGDGGTLTGMTAAPELARDSKDQPLRDANGHLVISATPEARQDDEENFGIPAGYTYLGQFVDHNLTFSPVDSFEATGDRAPVNLRSARFDLDCLYGRGPADQPYLFYADGRKLITGRHLAAITPRVRPADHPRIGGKAMIGDKRNDENVIISQLHGTVRAFHNQVATDDRTADFKAL